MFSTCTRKAQLWCCDEQKQVLRICSCSHRSLPETLGCTTTEKIQKKPFSCMPSDFCFIITEVYGNKVTSVPGLFVVGQIHLWKGKQKTQWHRNSYHIFKESFQKPGGVYLLRKMYYLVWTIPFSALALLRFDVWCGEGYSLPGEEGHRSKHRGRHPGLQAVPTLLSPHTHSRALLSSPWAGAASPAGTHFSAVGHL